MNDGDALLRAIPSRAKPNGADVTHTHPDLAALLAAVCQFPHDDTPRLVLADWLDDHGQPERAEFIRVQVELVRLEQNEEATEKGDREAYIRLRGLIGRQAALLSDPDRHVGWSGIKCPVCEGNGDFGGAIGSTHCADCNGTGRAPVEFRRGFVDRVTCRMRDVVRQSGEHFEDWSLTDWARGVLAAHPVTRWEITDREPWNGYYETHFGWWCETSIATYDDRQTMPRVLMDEMDDDPRRDDRVVAIRHTKYAAAGGCVLFADEAEARDALALAVGRVARRKWEEEVTPC